MAIAGSTGGITYGIEIRWGLNTVDSSSSYVNPRTTVQRTSGTTAASTANWTQIVATRAGTTGYLDELPADGKRRWYRIRHESPGFQPSTWLGIVDAKPVEIYEI